MKVNVNGVEYETDKIAVIMMASMGRGCAPALYGIDISRVEEFLEHPDTSGVIRGSRWMLVYTDLTSYIQSFHSGTLKLRKDTGAQDELLRYLNIDKIKLDEILKALGRKIQYK